MSLRFKKIGFWGLKDFTDIKQDSDYPELLGLSRAKKRHHFERTEEFKLLNLTKVDRRLLKFMKDLVALGLAVVY